MPSQSLTAVAQKPASTLPTSSNETVRLHLLQIAAEMKAEQEAEALEEAMHKAKEEPVVHMLTVTHWTASPSGKAIADELQRISKQEESK